MFSFLLCPSAIEGRCCALPTNPPPASFIVSYPSIIYPSLYLPMSWFAYTIPAGFSSDPSIQLLPLHFLSIPTKTIFSFSEISAKKLYKTFPRSFSGSLRNWQEFLSCLLDFFCKNYMIFHVFPESFVSFLRKVEFFHGFLQFSRRRWRTKGFLVFVSSLEIPGTCIILSV